MEMVIGILLLVTYVAFAIYAAKGGNLMLGFFVMAVLWAGLGAIAGVTVWSDSDAQLAEGMIDINYGIFEQGPELLGCYGCCHYLWLMVWKDSGRYWNCP